MPLFYTEHNRLVIAEEVRDQFTVAFEKFGNAIAYSADTLVVFDDEKGIKTFPITADDFRWLVEQFYVLKGVLYWGLYKAGKFNVNALRGATPDYVWDDQTVYYGDIKVEGADPLTFEEVGHWWARDARQVFHQKSLIPEIDRETFRVFDDTYAMDAR